jgi:phosphoglycolate phosphatase
MKKLLIFDLDGTIINSERVTQRIVERYCEKNGFPKIDIHNMLVSSQQRIIKEWEEFSDEEYQKNLYDLYCEVDNNLGNADFMPDLFENLQYILEKLSKENVLALYTSNGQNVATKVLKYYDIEKYFNDIKSWDDCEKLNIKPKPGPEMLEVINKNLNFDRNFMYYIGDTNKDILFAKNGNIRSVFVEWGYGKILDNSPDFIMKKSNDLLTL